MANSNLASRLNLVLLLLVGVLAGGIAGFFVGQANVPPVPTVVGSALPLNLNDVLALENVWIVEGFTCPMPDCQNPLTTCQGELPRRIRDWVNVQLAAGRSGQELRDEVIRTHGQALHKLP